MFGADENPRAGATPMSPGGGQDLFRQEVNVRLTSRSGDVRLAQQLFEPGVTGGTAAACSGFAANFANRRQAADGNRVGHCRFADFETMTNNRLVTVSLGVRLGKNLHDGRTAAKTWLFGGIYTQAGQMRMSLNCIFNYSDVGAVRQARNWGC